MTSRIRESVDSCGGGLQIPAHAEVVAVSMQRVRQPKSIAGPSQRLDNVARRDFEMIDLRVEIDKRSSAGFFPLFDAAGIDCFEAERAHGSRQPCQVIVKSVVVAVAHGVKDEVIVADK